MEIDISKETREVDKIFEKSLRRVEKGKMPSKADLAEFRRLLQQVEEKMAKGFEEEVKKLKKEGRHGLALFAQHYLDEFNKLREKPECECQTEVDRI